MNPLRLLGLLLLLMAQGAGAGAERTPARALALPIDTSGRVIVKFKSGAPTLRAHALGLGIADGAARAAIDRRADALGTRAGLRLLGGAALRFDEQPPRGAGQWGEFALSAARIAIAPCSSGAPA